MTTEAASIRIRARHASVLGGSYFVTAAATVRYTRFEGGVAFIWIAGALLFGTLIVSDRRRWPELMATCWLAAFAATWMFGLGPASAAPLAFCNVGEAALGACLLRRFRPGSIELKSVADIGFLLMCVGLVAPAVGAIFGAATASSIVGVPYWPNWRAWFAGHALGTVALAPIVILLLKGEVGDWMRSASLERRLEALLLVGSMAATTSAVFTQSELPLLFLPFLPMMVCVFRLGRFGAATSLIVLAAVTSVCTASGFGPLTIIQGGAGLQAEILQLYLATAVLMVLPAAGDLKRRNKALRDVEERSALHRLILDRTGDVILTLELHGCIRFASASAERILGLQPAQLVGTMPQHLIHPDDVEEVTAVHRRVVAEPDCTFTVEYRIVVEGRELGWFETHARATVDDDGEASGAVVIVRDVSDRKLAEERLACAALTDPLTGLRNRRSFDQALAGRMLAASGSRQAALAIFDLDHFKSVNDGHGHAAGDQVLRSFAEVLRTGVRTSDVVARLGGEEFVAIIEGDLDAARLVCDRIRRRLADTTMVTDAGARLKVTVSAGITPIPPQGSAEEVLARADAALYQAKAGGRNVLVAAS